MLSKNKFGLYVLYICFIYTLFLTLFVATLSDNSLALSGAISFSDEV